MFTGAPQWISVMSMYLWVTVNGSSLLYSVGADDLAGCRVKKCL